MESGAVIVLRAMVPKAREVFRIIVEQQSSEEGGASPRHATKSSRAQHACCTTGHGCVPVYHRPYMFSGPPGVDFHRLFKLSRDQFLVGVEANLKAHLTEFRDHQLLQIRCQPCPIRSCERPDASRPPASSQDKPRCRRGADGNDLFYVPLPADTLQNILREVSD